MTGGALSAQADARPQALEPRIPLGRPDLTGFRNPSGLAGA